MNIDSSPTQLLAYIEHIENRLAHATEFRYGSFTARQDKKSWFITSDDHATWIVFDGPNAKDDAIREAAKRGKQ